MANSDSTSSVPVVAPPLSSKENITPISSKISELSESRADIFNRIRGLKQDLQSWRSKLDTQVKTYRDELSEVKKSLNVEVEQLRYDFQQLKTTLQQQQEDVTASLRNLGLQDNSGKAEQDKGSKVETNGSETVKDLAEEEDTGKETEK